MGRHYGYSSKTEADHLKKIRIWQLEKSWFNGFVNGTISWTSGMLEIKSSVEITVCRTDGDGHIRFQYTQTESNGDRKDFDYKAGMTTTPCHFGGRRYWFTCPLSKSGVYCGRRVGVLYKVGDYFGCRHCYELTYSSKNTNRRYKNYPLFRAFDLEKKAEDLQAHIKKPYYKGKPTRRQRRLNQIHIQQFYNYSLLKRTGAI